jgi:hypothetical protein
MRRSWKLSNINLTTLAPATRSKLEELTKMILLTPMDPNHALHNRRLLRGNPVVSGDVQTFNSIRSTIGRSAASGMKLMQYNPVSGRSNR